MKILPITESDLHAYVDGLLPQSRCAEIAEHLAARPDQSARLESYRSQNLALRALFNPVLNEPVPARLSSVTLKNSWHVQRIAAGLAIALVSGACGWFLHPAGDQGAMLASVARRAGPAQQVSSLAREAAIAHVVYSPDLRHPVEIEADQEAQLVTWLSKRLGTAIHPPKLGKLGFELIGGRLLPGQTGPVAQFMYHDAAGERLTLYVSTEQSQNKDTGFKFAEQGPVKVFYWIDGKFGYALSGGIDKKTLAQVASAVYEQLESPG